LAQTLVFACIILGLKTPDVQTILSNQRSAPKLENHLNLIIQMQRKGVGGGFGTWNNSLTGRYDITISHFLSAKTALEVGGMVLAQLHRSSLLTFNPPTMTTTGRESLKRTRLTHVEAEVRMKMKL
jgi:hypothetical protein